ncbi:response regulator [uncultured Fibrella sp.]|uniref:response regulator n=1 Tax=uncultured Fibrella sp. TaxID=1284596 RepID=UPI0035C9D90E
MTLQPTSQIILVDDDEDDRLLIGSLLTQHCPGHTLRFAENGQELLDLLNEPDGLPVSLILLDLNMPVLGGFDTLRYLKGEGTQRSTPVVVLTTSEEPDDINRSYALGANAFLTKPAGHADLRTMVLQLRDFWLKLVRLPNGTPPKP